MDLATVTDYRLARRREDLRLPPDAAPSTVLVAGGTWVFSDPHVGVRTLVDLTGLGWPDLEPLPDGGLRVGATCPIATLAAHPGPTGAPTLFRDAAAALLMSFKVQQVATVGGNVCLGLPAGAMTSVLAGLGAEAVVWTPGGGERRLPVGELVVGVQRTALRPGEVLRAVEVSGAAMRAPASLRRIALTDHGRSAAVVVGTLADGTPRLVLTAAVTRPVVLTGGSPAELAEQVAGAGGWYDDPHGAPDWRAAMSARLVDEVLRDLDRLDGPGRTA
ncbi:xanthine dehydrogenase family protein subunit M [Nocardioides sp.]|uniref:FAD binding domain-containing protein n=1 Tax=Nocardioides sp. TaxID=35761 RepID=UPI003511E950